MFDFEELTIEGVGLRSVSQQNPYVNCSVLAHFKSCLTKRKKWKDSALEIQLNLVLSYYFYYL